MTKYRKGNIVRGIVTGIENYGIFISCDEYYSGLIHISEISHGFVKDVHDFVTIGEDIYVEILDVDHDLCQLKLSIKNITYKSNGVSKKQKIQETRSGFRTLAYLLPFWIDNSLKNFKKTKKN